MAFNKLLTFTKTVSDLADKPALTPTALKAQFDSSPNELKDAFNALIDGLKLTTSGDSGAKNIGVTTISGLTGNDVQTLLGSLKTYADGLITNGSDVNGQWTKFPDGTMIAYQKATVASDGTDFYKGTWTFTNAFVGEADVKVQLYNNYHGQSANGCASTYGAMGTATTVNWGGRFGAVVPGGNSVTVQVKATGRWK